MSKLRVRMYNETWPDGLGIALDKGEGEVTWSRTIYLPEWEEIDHDAGQYDLFSKDEADLVLYVEKKFDCEYNTKCRYKVEETG